MSDQMPPERPPSPYHPSHPHPAIRQANRTSDYLIFTLNVVASLCIIGFSAIIGFVIALGAEVSGEVDVETGGSPLFAFIVNHGTLLFIGILLLLFILISIRMMRQTYLGNALQVEYSNYAWLRDWSNRVAKDLDMPQVEIMITQDPVMNAFAFGFMRPYTIVLNSGTIRWMQRDELKAIVVHEMAHIKYKHTAMSAYSSILRTVPGLGILFGWMLDFWSRRAEFTADRLALAYLGDKETLKRSLIRIHVGPDVASSFSDIAQQWQVYNTSSGFNRFTQTFSSHPFLVRRLERIDATSQEWQPTKHKEEPNGSA